ncbi:hypothetical protein [Cryobacterium arcticum]|uniref:DUF4386 domain-containing protein n=1 Tax=Cryobacterium arcticum TaxID=670052 RepID=A0A1B1BMB6_9MICO|nr:hypothetical protein [Cryobacterium arcticum]ANP73685.1 hypothetical protein PA27867_2746 [Cryobacterium arcticum]
MKRFEGLARPSTLAAGVVFLAGGILDLALRLTGDPASELVQTPVFAVRSIALLGGALLLILSLVSIYERHAKQIGPFGFSAAIVAGTGTILISGQFWAEAFLYPTLGRVAPGLLDGTDRAGSYAFGLMLTAAVFGVGWLLLGTAILRARVYRVLPAVVILAGGAVSLLPGNALGQTVLGAGLVLLSFSPSYRKHEGPKRQASPAR